MTESFRPFLRDSSTCTSRLHFTLPPQVRFHLFLLLFCTLDSTVLVIPTSEYDRFHVFLSSTINSFSIFSDPILQFVFDLIPPKISVKPFHKGTLYIKTFQSICYHFFCQYFQSCPESFRQTSGNTTTQWCQFYTVVLLNQKPSVITLFTTLNLI